MLERFRLEAVRLGSGGCEAEGRAKVKGGSLSSQANGNECEGSGLGPHNFCFRCRIRSTSPTVRGRREDMLTHRAFKYWFGMDS